MILLGCLLAFSIAVAPRLVLVLAWIFASWTRPIVVMAIIPFGLVGTIYGHLLWDVPLSMFTVVGLIGMTGIIINDSIVLVTTIDDYATERGLIPAIISVVVLQKVGVHDAMRLFLTGDRFEAPRAHEYGLVHRVVAAEALEAALPGLGSTVLHADLATPLTLADLVEMAGGALCDDSAAFVAQYRREYALGILTGQCERIGVTHAGGDVSHQHFSRLGAGDFDFFDL